MRSSMMKLATLFTLLAAGCAGSAGSSSFAVRYPGADPALVAQAAQQDFGRPGALDAYPAICAKAWVCPNRYDLDTVYYLPHHGQTLGEVTADWTGTYGPLASGEELMCILFPREHYPDNKRPSYIFDGQKIYDASLYHSSSGMKPDPSVVAKIRATVIPDGAVVVLCNDLMRGSEG